MSGPYVLLDDDPTGAQLSRDVTVLLDSDPALVAAALTGSPRAVHIVTNSRALTPQQAYRVTRAAAAGALTARPDARLVLRGDSTLRAHLIEEYTAVRDVAFPTVAPVLLLVPALPSAGRITVDGVHYLERDGQRIPLADTEYARDGGFSYPSSDLLAYADHRSAGLLPAERGTAVSLAALRRDGADAVVGALRSTAAYAPAVVVVDAESDADLAVVAAALADADRVGIPTICRCSPALAALLAARPSAAGAPTPILTARPTPAETTTPSGTATTLARAAPTRPSGAATLAGGATMLPKPGAPGGVLIVCGSYVAGTTDQLAVLTERLGCIPIEVDVAALASDAPAEEIARAAAAASLALTSAGVAVLSTPRHRPDHLRELSSGLRIAEGLATAAAAVRPTPSVVLTKGGITSAVVIRSGFGVRQVRVVGPIAPGVSLWHADNAPPFAVFPGNVGTPNALADLVLRILGRGTTPQHP